MNKGFKKPWSGHLPGLTQVLEHTLHIHALIIRSGIFSGLDSFNFLGIVFFQCFEFVLGPLVPGSTGFKIIKLASSQFFFKSSKVSPLISV